VSTEHAEPGPTPAKGIKVTVTDLDIGESDSRVIWDDYVIICAGACHVAHTSAYASGTHVLTVKGRRTL
jgi:hypothetical protein